MNTLRATLAYLLIGLARVLSWAFVATLAASGACMAASLQLGIWADDLRRAVRATVVPDSTLWGALNQLQGTIELPTEADCGCSQEDLATVAPELTMDDPQQRVVNAIEAIWLKSVADEASDVVILGYQDPNFRIINARNAEFQDFDEIYEALAGFRRLKIPHKVFVRNRQAGRGLREAGKWSPQA